VEGSPNILVPLALFGWIPVVLLVFSQLPPRKAVILLFMAGWMFLPSGEGAIFKVQGIPEYTKSSATCLGLLLAVVLFDAPALGRLRWRWVDLPMVLFCLSPLFSSLTNGLGLYDGISESFKEVVKWGMPYLVGRLYFSDRQALGELVAGVFVGGLAYVPFCVLEMLISPQLHRLVYGYHQHSFAQTVRYGGYRPMVFMDHGLMVGMWMAAAAAGGLWLLYSGGLGLHLQRLFSLRAEPVRASLFSAPLLGLLVALLLVMSVAVKSTGAIILMVVAIASLFAAARLRFIVPALLLLVAFPVYVGLRAYQVWDGTSIVAMVAKKSMDRAQSLEFRIDNENKLGIKAIERPVFGWGGWGRSRIFDENGKDLTVTDGQWIILLGTRGFFAVVIFTLVMGMPLLLLWRRCPLPVWRTPEVAPLAFMAVWLLVYLVDCIPNAMINPVFTLFIGGMIGWGVSPEEPPATADESPPPRPAGTRVLAC
jgi:hypothetical protein